jgi:hypothetical protein
MPFAREATAFHRYRFKAALFALALLGGMAGQGSHSSAQAATAEEKEELGLLYMLQMAPSVCEWTNAGDSSKLDAKVVETENALGITDAEKADFKTTAEAELRKAGNCDADGLARALYDEIIK